MVAERMQDIRHRTRPLSKIRRRDCRSSPGGTAARNANAGTFAPLLILDMLRIQTARRLPSMMKYLTLSALVLATAATVSAQAVAGEKHHHRHYQPVERERYVPASDDLLYQLFGGPRYYDQQLFTTAAGACSYDRVGPDANATNKINDHHCGK
jgi:hypothetical protein